MLKIKAGSVFDEKCDLLILPRSAGGAVTPWVRSEIWQNDLPFSNERIPFGEVLFQSTDARYAKADYIGYAASVIDGVGSTLVDISNIVDRIIAFGIENSCTIVNLPALGTGAGGLEPADVLNIYRAKFAGVPAQFNVYLPDKPMARMFLNWNEEESTAGAVDRHPRVFISYSWKDGAVKDWVYNLAKKLRANGVDARLDRFHLRPGMDLPQWMANEILKAEKVLLICDAHYALKADTRHAGVGWETMIIQGDMMLQGEVNNKYIAIAFGDSEKNTPIYMRSKLAMSRADVDGDINQLLEQVFDIDASPDIGAIPDWVKTKRKLSRE
jgi:hypothetical protein